MKKTSVELKVAIAVAVGFVALTIGAMAQGHSGGGTDGPNGYGPMNNPGVESNEPSGSAKLRVRPHNCGRCENEILRHG